jgi:riboflavin synthase
MFTGLITAVGEVRDVSPLTGSSDMRLLIGAPAGFLAGADIGASIACSGCCLTAISLEGAAFAVQVSQESLSRTTIGRWTPGTRVNLERSLRLGDELGGHLVSGHVDGLGTIAGVQPEHGSLRLSVDIPEPLHRFVAAKGSVAIDGVSLTVNDVQGRRFEVNIIPHTASHTTLGERRPGDPVNVEIDMLARYVARLAETSPTGASQ